MGMLTRRNNLLSLNDGRQAAMKRIHTDSYQDACLEMQRLKSQSAGKPSVVRIVKSPYHGFDVVVIDQDLYTDLIASHLVDGLPTIFPPGNPSLKETAA